MFLEVLSQFFRCEVVEYPSHLGVTEFSFGLSLELGFLQLDTDDTGHSFADILALEVVVPVLQDLVFSRVIVENAG